jgi:hypothetical protein
MKKTYPRPKWYILYLLTILYLFVFWLQLKESISEAGHVWVEAGLTCAYFGLVFAWLKANEYAMWIEDREKREVSRRSWAVMTTSRPERAQEPGSARNGNSRLEQTSERWISQVLPAWMVVLISHFGDLFKDFRQV